MMYNNLPLIIMPEEKLSMHISLIEYDILVNPVFYDHLPPHHQNHHSPETVDFFPGNQIKLRQIILGSARR